MADLNTPQAAMVLQQLDIQRDEQQIVIKKKHLRLLELEQERLNVLKDIEASEAHIEQLDVEMAQQRERLDKEQEGEGT